MTFDRNRNPANYHTDIELAAFEPPNLVPDIGPSPDKMLPGCSPTSTPAATASVQLHGPARQLTQGTERHFYAKDGPVRLG